MRVRLLLVVVAVTSATVAGRQRPPAPLPLALDVALDARLEAAPAAPPAVDATRAYVPLRNGRLTAIDLGTGQPAWTVDLATTVGPALAGDLVISATTDAIVALARVDGARRWSLPLPAPPAAAPVAGPDRVVVGLTTGQVLSVQLANGTRGWTQSLGASLAVAPLIVQDRLYASLADGRVAALSLATGEVLWQRQLGGAAGEVAVDDERLYVGSGDKFFYCLRTGDGDIRWKWRGGGPIGVAAIDAHHVYYTAFDNVLRALDRKSGTQRWKRDLTIRPSGGPLVAGDLVIVAGTGADVRAFRARDGHPAGEFSLPVELAAAPRPTASAVSSLVSVLVVTRTATLQIWQQSVEPAPVPLAYPLGEDVVLTVVAGIE